MLMGLAVELVRHVSTQEFGAGSPRSTRQVRHIVDYVMDNLAAPLGVADIARGCNMSVRHVARVFKDGTGVSLGNSLRAAGLLSPRNCCAATARGSRRSLALRLQQHLGFSAAFRVATGQTPRTFAASRGRFTDRRLNISSDGQNMSRRSH